MSNPFLLFGAINGFLFVALGAFGSHGLKGKIPDDLFSVWETAAQYQGIHALALVATGLLILQWPDAGLFRWAGWLFLAGIILFSGSLYLLAATGARWLGPVTPFGGLSFLAAWSVLAYALFVLDKTQ
ncbi:MAG: DUF423 domain-containing protein [Gammaproteobacteria bacterium]